VRCKSAVECGKSVAVDPARLAVGELSGSTANAGESGTEEGEAGVESETSNAEGLPRLPAGEPGNAAGRAAHGASLERSQESAGTTQDARYGWTGVYEADAHRIPAPGEGHVSRELRAGVHQQWASAVLLWTHGPFWSMGGGRRPSPTGVARAAQAALRPVS